MQTNAAIQIAVSPDVVPWWGVPVVAGGFLLGGAILGFVFNFLLERRRQSRTEGVRWDSDIRTLSADAVAAARGAVRATTAAAAFVAGYRHSVRRRMSEEQKSGLKELEPDLDLLAEKLKTLTKEELRNSPDLKEYEDTKRENWERLEVVRAGLLLIAPVHICDAITKLTESVGVLVWRRGDDDPPRDDLEAVSAAQLSLVSAVRTHLGVGKLPQSHGHLDLV